MEEKVNTKVHYIFLFAKSHKYYYYYINDSKDSKAIQYDETYKFLINYIQDKNLKPLLKQRINRHENFLLDVDNQAIHDVELDDDRITYMKQRIPSIKEVEKSIRNKDSLQQNNFVSRFNENFFRNR